MSMTANRALVYQDINEQNIGSSGNQSVFHY